MNRRWKLTLEYDGTSFLGWQKQPYGRTVQMDLERALSIFCREDVMVYGQGRTDRGVHAKGQVAHVDLPLETDLPRLVSAMKGLLPEDVALLSAEPVSELFHARFDAVSRVYSYRVLNRPSPLARQVGWVVPRPFNPDLLHSAAALLCGEFDFQAFARLDRKEERGTRCVIFGSEWAEAEGGWAYRIEGNRFLRHMVRRLVGTMMDVAVGKISLSEMEYMLINGSDISQKGQSAPARGLCLEIVRYSEEEASGRPGSQKVNTSANVQSSGEGHG